MNNIWQQLKTSFTDLKKNKIRTGMTSLGILIGVMAVVLLVAFGQGLKNYILDEFESLGSNVVYVYPGNVLAGGTRPGGGFLGGAKFDERDLKSLMRITAAKHVVPVFVRRSKVQGDGEEKVSDLYATSESLFELRDIKPKAGRLFNDADVQRADKVAVLGPKLADDLFGSAGEALGKQIRVSGQRFKVIGVVEKQGGASLGGPDFDSYTYIPRTAALGLNPEKIIFSFYIQAENGDMVQIVKQQAKDILLKRYDEEDFTVADQKEFLQIVDSILKVMNEVMVAIGSISLLVGGVGIMNIMYASVNDRVNEVGIRRALGATQEDILILFLTESVMLSLLGGLLGLSLAGLIVLLVRVWFPASITLWSMMVALGVSSGIGVFFGVWPAMRAAKRSPIEAIRYE